MEAAEYLEVFRGAGPVGVLATIGLAAGATSGKWPVEYQANVARVGFGALILSLVWFVFMLVYRLTGWRVLRYLEAARPRDD